MKEEVKSQKEFDAFLKVKDFLKKYNLMILLLLFIIIASMLSPNFFTVKNFLNLLQQSSITGIIAVGMTCVILIGGIDLSVGSIAALSGMSCSILITNGVPIFFAIIISMILGALIGSLAGLVIGRFKLPAFIATLAMMEIARGLALLTTGGKPVFGLLGSFRLLGAGFIGQVPISGIVWILISIGFAIMLKYTQFGRSLFAIGGNKEAAMLSGIKINKNLTIVYLISGTLSAFAGVIMASWLSVGQPTAAKGIELDAIAAVVLGGTSLAGGKGGVIGTFGGVFLMAIITNLFNLIGLPSYYQQIFKGLIIIFALLLNKVVIERDTTTV